VPRSITRHWFRASTVLVACALTGLMSGCGAGRISQTAHMAPAVPGFNADSPDGTVSVRDVVLAFKADGYAPGSDAPLALRLFNNTVDQTITLKQVTSDTGTVCLAGSGQVPIGNGTTAPLTPSPSASASPSVSATPSVVPSTASPSATKKATGAPSATATPSPTETSPSPSPSPSCVADLSLSVPPQGYATLSPDTGPYLAVTRVKPGKQEGDGNVYKVTLTFTFGSPGQTIKDVSATVAPPGSPLPRSPLQLQPSE
jgi:hypothetical protein